MQNKDKYRFNDFTLENYKKIIDIAKKNEFSFNTFENPIDGSEKCLLWRHDVEFSPDMALRMAEIENNKCVRATYFFQLHSEFYNILEKHYSNILIKIRSHGHEIGLHFDTHYFNIEKEKNIEKYLILDKNYFELMFQLKLKVFSFHNTNKFILNCQKKKYAGLINVYSKYFRQEFSYCADSTGFWRHEILEDILKDHKLKKIQVLTHDAMWKDEVLPPRQRVFKAIDERADFLKRFYDKTLKEFGVKNIDWNNDY